MKPIFSLPLTVSNEHIDSLKHVNNQVYLSWILMVTDLHSESLGYTLNYFIQSGGCFVVRKHQLNYLLPAHLNDELVIETWITSLKAAQSNRVCRIKRVKDDRVIFSAETVWVYIDLLSGRPIEIPSSMRENYGRFLHE